MSDYKYGTYLIAEELAGQKYEKSFYELSDEQQCALMDEASTAYVERRIP